MNIIWRTMWYFFINGLVYGLVLGAWSTTIMFPIIGTFFGLLWGAGIGTACGLVCGVLVSLIQTFSFHPDIAQYSRRLSIGLGTLVAIIAPILLIATSSGILWGEYRSDAPGLLIPSLVAVIFWGGLSAAYVAYNYPVWFTGPMRGGLANYGFDATFWPIIKTILQKDTCAITLILGGVLGAAMRSNDFLRFERMNTTVLNEGRNGAVAGMIGAALVVLVVSFGAATLITFLRRLMFSDDSSSHRQRLILTGSAAIFTGVVCCWPLIVFKGLLNWGWLFPALGTLLMGFYVYRALTVLNAPEKAKRKEAASRAVE